MGVFKIMNLKKSIQIVIVGMFILTTINSGLLLAEREEGGEILWTFDADLFVKHIESADLNGDNIEDIIAAEYDSDGYDDVSNVYGIDGSSSATLWTYQLDSGARAMTIGDLNNDGVMDAVIGASMGSTTPDGKVHAIDGTDGSMIWTFAPGGSGDTIGDVAVGDFNGDAFDDVAVACWDNFVYAVDGATGSELWNHEIDDIFINGVSTNDVNNDGIDDVSYAHSYLAGYDNEIGVLDGTNGGVIWNLIIPSTGEDTLLVDIDDDGENEAIFGVVKDDDDVEVQVRNGLTGDLEWSSIIGPGVSGVNPTIFLFTHDIDQDSDRDLLIGNEYVDFRIRAYDGDSSNPMWISDEELSGYPRDMAFGDVNGNGYQNIVAATYDRIQILNATNGVKDWYQSVAGTIKGAAVGDFNDDGITDVACSGGAEYVGDDPAKAVWAIKTIEVSPVLWEKNVGSYGNAIALGDFTGDGALDVIAVNSDDKAYALNGTNGDTLWEWTDLNNLYTTSTGDFNGDGIDDAAIAGGENRITALDGVDGSKLWQFSTGDQCYRKTLQSAELNNDGKCDVIAGCDDSYVYAINGETGSPLWSVDLSGSVRDVNLYQMNDAGVLDVVAAASNEIAVIDGSDGSIIWKYTTDVSSAKHVDALDANDDGIMDISWGSLYKVELVNGDTQSLIWSQPISVNSDYCLASADLNSDDKTDVVVGGGADDTDVLALNALDGSLLWDFTTGGDVNCVFSNDVDEDGQIEIIAGSDDQHVYVIDIEGNELWSYSTADDLMHLAIGDVTGDTRPNIVTITFGFDGVVYAFSTLSEAGQPPTADFTYSPQNPTTNDIIQFTDTSVDADGFITSWYWDFGDGNTSTIQNPTHTYQQKGTYTVTLMVTDNLGDMDSTSTQLYVETYGPIADFSYMPLNPDVNEQVQFTDQSTDTSTGSITTWYWEFGDGDTSTVQDPTHTYDENGTYQVNLTVTNNTGISDSITKNINVGETSITLSFLVGWNLITVPVETDWNASDLASNVSGCLSVSGWNASLQTYDTYIVGVPPSDFPLKEGYGYFVDVDVNSSLQVSGPVISSVSVPLEIGWNLIGWYDENETTASSLAENITGCLSVSCWNASLQTYETYITGVQPSDFVISRGMGLFVDVNQTSIWFGQG